MLLSEAKINQLSESYDDYFHRWDRTYCAIECTYPVEVYIDGRSYFAHDVYAEAKATRESFYKGEDYEIDPDTVQVDSNYCYWTDEDCNDIDVSDHRLRYGLLAELNNVIADPDFAKTHKGVTYRWICL